ncbi:DEAD/DEAH box helicase [Mailhella massiliensis]|uniref:DEAD/DEAH box helicase n=1 Tax=Mailhella massiliensis TaxID=1903261 RepID=A0A921AYK2_9BACT|nr:DEAD/DEAH box helicase [Mailhella massiliensis]HJD98249.1 DEAD/DEAH box helicase [Mailhella massiliensis]
MPDTINNEEELHVTAPEDSLPPCSLEDLPESMREACARAGWTRLMPVQAHTLPYLMAGRDLMVQSRTGSGKTGAYLLPLLSLLNPEEKKPQALILAPTRELANQVEHEAAVLLEGTGLSAAALYGGVGYGRQLEALRAGVQLIVGTPGRVLDHLLRRTLSLDSLRALVFDEADRMLSIGFYPDMKEIQRYLPKRPLLAALFSATYPQHVLNLAGEFLRDPQMLSLSQGQVHVATIQHLYVECGRMDKDRTLVRLMETENPTSAIIFCNTKSNVHYVTAVLKGFGYNADELSADLSQNKREEVLTRLREGKVRLLVATDVAARGIDIPALSHVFLYEPPEDRESYIHRAGRTGRAGAAGTVISLVDIMEKMELQRIASFYRIDIAPLPNPTDEDVALAAGRRETALLDARRRACTGLQLERARRYLPLVKELARSEDEDQLLLLALLLDADYQRSLGMEQSLPKSRAEREAEAPRRRRRGKEEGASEEEGGEKPRSSRRRSRKKEKPEEAAPEAVSGEMSTQQGEVAPAPEAQAAPEGEGRRRRPRRRSRRRASSEGEGGQAGGEAPAQPEGE